MIEILPCIVCGAKLESAVPKSVGGGNQPSGGTSFSTHGHYGSTVFDPMDREGLLTLQINVCDPCMKKKAADGAIYIVIRHYIPVEDHYDIWDGERG